MRKDVVLFFSSDATPLYKGDVFRVLALPRAYRIQFRYPYGYVAEEFQKDPRPLIGKAGLVVFVAGNDLNKKENERTLQFFPIRACKVSDAFNDTTTEQIIVILELEEFAACSIDTTLTPDTARPPAKFVAQGTVADHRPTDWINRVKAVEGVFRDTLFYTLSDVRKKTEAVKPCYDAHTRSSYFNLEEECEYTLECSCYDPGGGLRPLRIDTKSDMIEIVNVFEAGARAPLDTRRLRVSPRTAKARSLQIRSMFFSPSTVPLSDTSPFADTNFVEIQWRIVRSWSKVMKFGVITAMAAIGLLFLQTGLADKDGSVRIDHTVSCVRVVGVVLIGAAAALLYRHFNKV